MKLAHPEDGPLKPPGIVVYLPGDYRERLRAIAHREERTLAAQARIALMRHVDAEESR